MRACVRACVRMRVCKCVCVGVCACVSERECVYDTSRGVPGRCRCVWASGVSLTAARCPAAVEVRGAPGITVVEPHNAKPGFDEHSCGHHILDTHTHTHTHMMLHTRSSRIGPSATTTTPITIKPKLTAKIVVPISKGAVHPHDHCGSVVKCACVYLCL